MWRGLAVEAIALGVSRPPRLTPGTPNDPILPSSLILWHNITDLIFLSICAIRSSTALYNRHLPFQPTGPPTSFSCPTRSSITASLTA